MASFPDNHHYQQFLPQPSSHTQQSNNPFGTTEDQISQQVSYFNIPNLLDQQHHPYIPPAPFQVDDLGQEESSRLELQWNLGFESKRKTPIEQMFLENNLDINKCRNNSQVSTGLGLSLENPRLSSLGESALLGEIGDAFECELRRQDAEIDRYLKLEGDFLRRAILEKFEAAQLQTISYIEGKVLKKLREKEAEVEDINKKKIELESRIEQLAMEANSWQQHAKYGENMIHNLQLNLQQVANAQNRDSKEEGCGESEVDDTASCSSSRHPIDFTLLFDDRNETKERMIMCKVCRTNEACMMLLPCKHLCLCKNCESESSLCPVCHCSKYLGMEVFM